MCEDEIRESPFRTYAMELTLVLWIHLQPQTNSKNETGHTGDEPAEEAVKRERADEAAVNELYHSGEEHV